MSGSLTLEIKRHWKPRKLGAHKGDFGKVFILAGSKGLTGAAYLAASAAVRAGAGLVSLGVPQTVYSVLARRSAEVMTHAYPATKQGSFSYAALHAILKRIRTQDVAAVGPGMSRQPQTQKLIRAVTAKTRLPVVLDADGLNAFSGCPELLKKNKGRIVLTPHPAEFRRLFGGKISDRLQDRIHAAQKAAKKYGLILVLKGHRTVVAATGKKPYVNSTGNPGMATGGSGDVLTGIIAALAAQGLSLWDAARFGVYFHGLAGDLQPSKPVGQLGGYLK